MDDYEVNLRDYFHVLWKQKWIVIVTFLVAVATALGISYSSPKTYQTETSLLILPPLATEVGGEVTALSFLPRLTSASRSQAIFSKRSLTTSIRMVEERVQARCATG